MQEILATQQDFELYVPMPDGVNQGKLTRATLKAQRSILSGFLGAPLYLLLYTNQDSSPYTELLNGGSYSEGGKTYPYYGLKPAIAFYSYALYLDQNRVLLTRTGSRVKQSETSQQASPEEISAEIRRSLDQGAKYLLNAREYIQANRSDFQEFENGKILAGLDFDSIGQPRYKGKYGKAYGSDGKMIGWNGETY